MVGGREGGMTRGSNRRAAMVLTLVAVLGLVAAACSSDEGGGTVAVTLQEFAVVPAESSIAAGEVTFEVTNEGPDDVHEFVVFKTDLAPGALPTGEDGSVGETGGGPALLPPPGGR